MSVLVLVIQAASVAATAWAFGGVGLALLGKISWRKYWLIRMPGDVAIILWNVTEHDYVWTAVSVGTLFIDYWLWKTSADDDDDWGKRLKSWAKSHIPRPTIVALRPQGSPA